MRNTAPNFFKINPDGLTTLRMPVIPTSIGYYYGQIPHFCCILERLRPLLEFYFRREENVAGGKFREIPFAVDIIFAGGKFRAKSKFANSENFLHAKNLGYTVLFVIHRIGISIFFNGLMRNLFESLLILLSSDEHW